jgi:thymidine kinase
LVLLGETEEYEPLSRAAFYKAELKEKVKKMKVDSEEISPSKKDNNA